MAARQGVDILIALVHAELTWQFSTLCQSSNYRLIDLKFFVDDYVLGYSNPAKFRLRRKTGDGSRWWWHIRFMWLFFFFFFFFVSRDRVPSKPVDRFLHIVAYNTRFGVRKCLLGFIIATLHFWGRFTPKIPQNCLRMGISQPNWKSRITFKRSKIGKTCQ